ncbi:MAG: glycosyltransferase [Ilumatobacteraceae bacterium]
MANRSRRACIVRFQPLDLPTRREATALVAEGFEVHVLCLKDEGDATHELVDGFHVRRVKMKKRRGSKLTYLYEYLAWFGVGSGWLLAKHLRHRWSVIQVSTLPDTQVFATLIPRLTGAKVVVFLKEPTGELFESLYGSAKLGRLMNMVTDLAVRFSNLAFAVSEEHKQTYVDRGLNPDKIVSIVNAMPIEPLQVTWADRRPDPDHFVVACHGTIEERWGHEIILRAAALAPPRGPESADSVHRAGQLRADDAPTRRRLASRTCCSIQGSSRSRNSVNS